MKYRLIALGLLLASSVAAQDELELDSISIIGNRELPKTITIVPWKKALPGSSIGRPQDSVLSHALTPVDRDVFRRELSYYRQLNPLSDANSN
ncbi:MAG: hypothetical protein AAF434_14235 [Pseudomonadota bacterium]